MLKSGGAFVTKRNHILIHVFIIRYQIDGKFSLHLDLHSSEFVPRPIQSIRIAVVEEEDGYLTFLSIKNEA